MSIYKLETKEKPQINLKVKSLFINRVLDTRWGHIIPVSCPSKTDGSYQLKSCIDEG